MRVGMISLQHESNTFLPLATDLDSFKRDTYLTGAAIRGHFQAAHHEVGGMFAGLAAAGIDAAPIFAARATPSGTITADAASALVDHMLRELDSAGPIDGLLVAPHGAAVAENEPDFDGHWLNLLRRKIGPTTPMICTLDLHANVSQRMIDACNATIAYRSNPHLDQRDRGIEAATLMARTLRGEVSPTQAACLPPIAINIERQLTDISPCRELIARIDEIRQSPGVLSASAVLGFPYADVVEMGSSFIVVTNNDPARAQLLADEIGAYVLEHRHAFEAELIPVDQALAQAMREPGPVCLLDIGDNVGGGSPADGTALACAIHRLGVGPAIVCINDPATVKLARAAGIGKTVELSVGGKVDSLQGSPLTAPFRVVSFSDGAFEELQPRHGGKTGYDMGPCAVIETASGLTILLTSRRTPPFSLGQLTSCGLDPSKFRLIVAKGVHVPVAAYRPVCKSFIRVNTPGVTTADMSALPYQHRRRPLFPLEEVSPFYREV